MVARSTGSGRPWLAAAIEDASAQRLCFAYWCQLCAPRVVAHIMRSAAEQAGEPDDSGRVTTTRILATARGLADLPEPTSWEEEGRLGPAVRYILGRILWGFRGEEYAEAHLVQTLRGSWAGMVLDCMKAHTAAREQRRADDAQREAERARVRREERAARHVERMRVQAEQNRRWYAARQTEEERK